ncbi:MAG: hypothetical protein IIB12_06160 [Chloroflexi bacterium]|nr:hypothetical protein [Chloroflexota bacterium]
MAPLIKFSETPSEIKNVEPRPGAFTDEILGPLGYTRDRIRELTELGVVE